MAKTTTAPQEGANTKVVTKKVRLSYCHVWEPASMNDGSGDKKYSVSIIIPKSDTEMVEIINKAVNAAKEAGKAGKFQGKIPPNLKLPLRDGDTDRPEDEAYKNSYFITASSKTKPGIVDKNRQPIIDESEVYSGVYARVSLNFYAFNSNGSKGVACGLNHIQKIADGEALGGRSTPEEDFDDDFEVDDDIA